MILSINPTYYCNFRCNFCYLTEEQLSNRQTASCEQIKQRIKEVQEKYDVTMVDLYGGEIGLLPSSYMDKLYSTINECGIDDINIITNLSMVNETITDPRVYVTVSYDFNAREQHDRVWNNMFLLPSDFSILILASQEVINGDVKEMIEKLNMLSNLVSVEIKPYSTNQANTHNVTHKDFEEFVKKWINAGVEKNFIFVNQENIIESLLGKRNAFSNDHVYITPQGKFAVLEFDKDDNEYFLELDSVDEYTNWANQEPEKNTSDICKNCNYYGHCLTEHYRYVTDLTNSCNGFKGLLDYYSSRG